MKLRPPLDRDKIGDRLVVLLHQNTFSGLFCRLDRLVDLSTKVGNAGNGFDAGGPIYRVWINVWLSVDGR